MTENSGPDLSGTRLVTDGGQPYLLRAPQGEKLDKYPALIMLHGYGANEGDIYELVPYVAKNVLVAAVRAPLKASDDPRGSFAWYERTGQRAPEVNSLQNAIATVKAVLDGLEKTSGYPIDRQKIFIGGFSQGGAMSLFVTASYPELIAGTIVHSGYLQPNPPVALDWDKMAGKSFLVLHGTNDAVLPIKDGREAVKFLQEKGAKVEFHEFPLAHETSPESRHALADWLNQRV